MVEVSVRENHVLDIRRSYRQILPVPLTPFFWSLKQPAIHQDLGSIFARQIIGSINQVLRSGHGARCA